MDTTGIILAVLLAIAVVGQLCLPLIGRWNRRRQARDLAFKRARLLEDAADRQLQQSSGQAGTVTQNSHNKGMPDADH